MSSFRFSNLKKVNPRTQNIVVEGGLTRTLDIGNDFGANPSANNFVFNTLSRVGSAKFIDGIISNISPGDIIISGSAASPDNDRLSSAVVSNTSIIIETSLPGIIHFDQDYPLGQQLIVNKINVCSRFTLNPSFDIVNVDIGNDLVTIDIPDLSLEDSGHILQVNFTGTPPQTNNNYVCIQPESYSNGLRKVLDLSQKTNHIFKWNGFNWEDLNKSATHLSVFSPDTIPIVTPANATYQAANFQSIIKNEGGFTFRGLNSTIYAGASGNSTIRAEVTVPKTGFYHCATSVEFYGNSIGYREIGFSINDSTDFETGSGYFFIDKEDGSANGNILNSSGTIYIREQDRLNVQLFQNSSSSLVVCQANSYLSLDFIGE